MKKFSLTLCLGLVWMFQSCFPEKQSILTTDIDEAESIAKEAYIFSYPLLMG